MRGVDDEGGVMEDLESGEAGVAFPEGEYVMGDVLRLQIDHHRAQAGAVTPAELYLARLQRHLVPGLRYASPHSSYASFSIGV